MKNEMTEELARALARFAVAVKFDTSLYVISEAVEAGLVERITPPGAPTQFKKTALGEQAAALAVASHEQWCLSQWKGYTCNCRPDTMPPVESIIVRCVKCPYRGGCCPRPGEYCDAGLARGPGALPMRDGTPCKLCGKPTARLGGYCSRQCERWATVPTPEAGHWATVEVGEYRVVCPTCGVLAGGYDVIEDAWAAADAHKKEHEP